MKTKRPKFPLVIKRGSCSVKIYEDRKPTGIYFRVVYHLGGKRHRLNFNDLNKATIEAEAKASQFSRGDIDAVQLSGRDRLVYGRALEAVKEFEIPLDAAALEYSAARKVLSGSTLLDAARFYERHHGRGIKSKAVADAVAEMIATKSAAGVSELYLADLRYRLGVFRDAFHCDVSALAPDDLKRFFDELNLSPRSYNNFRRAVGTFFGFAQNHGWLSKDAELISRVEKRKEKAAPVEIFTPAELGKLLEHASNDLAPCLALGAFAGLRAEEILRLEWADLDWSPGFVVIAAHKAKTATRRLVPITDNLGRWLSVAQRAEGGIWRHSKPWFFEATRKAASDAKVKWKQNALRHSFITYRLADVQDVNRVALEAGNSAQMIFRHYRELATPEEAARWFSIAPETAANVVSIRKLAG